ncbi:MULTISPECIES: contractile injection system protein, VgrG/Pvc8 family [Streptomyces violaceoruber group]|uniref:contractile injection system protein, VgrG/Pvc8 family n=1 Tax=Streptomyces violaceoruber group TaxID=2867121 RepID=UPI00362E1387
MSTYQLFFDKEPVGPDFYDGISSLEVEENAHLPGALRLVLPVAVEDGQLTRVSDANLKPYTRVAVVATPDGAGPQCVFDGYVLSHKVHLEAGVTASTVEVWAQDASVLMRREEKVKEWPGMTEGEVANQVFAAHKFRTSPKNTADDSPRYTESDHTLMQRGSDYDFLRRLARRSGRWFRVACADKQGEPTGYFAVPELTGDPVATLHLNDARLASVSSLDFHWDVARPTKVAARQADLADADQGGAVADSADSGLPTLGERRLADFAGGDTSVLLTAPGDAAHLPGRVRALLREASWFVGCEGVADVARLGAVLRVGQVVGVAGVGNVLSGRYLVTGVRHTISTQRHTMAFTLAGNALGMTPQQMGGGLLASVGL